MQDTGLTFEDFESKMMLHMDVLLYWGLKSADKDLKITKEETLDMLDADIKLIQVISEKFAEDLVQLGEIQPAEKSAIP